MFRRSTKITSLIVAAASVATMVPAMAADTARVTEKDGTVYKAVAYKDGTFYVDGDIDEKGEGVFYLKDGKYTELEDLDAASDAVQYGDKYVKVEEGDYYVDLSTGKVNDEDDLEDDDLYDAKSAVERKIKKDAPDRFGMDKGDAVPFGNYTPHGKKYAESLYEFDVDGKHVYSDVKGNYVEADNDLGKIKLVTDDAATLVTLESFKDDVKEGNYKYKAFLEDATYLAQDKDYIYRKIELTIKKKQKDADDSTYATIKAAGLTDAQKETIKAEAIKAGKTTDDAIELVKEAEKKADKNLLFFGGKKDRVAIHTDADGKISAIQKISKAQSSDDVDGAKKPKSVETFFINEYKDFDDKGKVAGSKDELDYWTVSDGKLVTYGPKDDDKFKAITYNLKTKAGFGYVDTSDSDFDVDGYYSTIDKDGNIWVLSEGKVRTYKTSGSWDTVYKVDGSMEQLSVYDKDNVIAWNEDEEIYCIVGGKSSTDVKEEETTTPAAAGWVQDATTGAWSYVKADGTKAIGWFQSPTSGLWYYMDANGVMQANGWIQDGGYWYFLDATGAMKTGWVYTGGAWYFLKNTAGNMGAMQTGWIQTGGKWYYCNASGAMLSNTTVGGYVLGADGAWIK